MYNFASESIKRAQKNSRKHPQLKMKRDTFGFLFALSLEHRIDIEICLSSPLVPLLPAISKWNSDMFQTVKSKAVAALQCHLKSVNCPENLDEDIYAINGFHLLRALEVLFLKATEWSQRLHYEKFALLQQDKYIWYLTYTVHPP